MEKVKSAEMGDHNVLIRRMVYFLDGRRSDNKLTVFAFSGDFSTRTESRVKSCDCN